MKVGVKVASAAANGPIPALRKVALYCVETGEVIEGLVDLDISYSVHGVIEITAKILPSEVIGTSGELYPNR